MKSDPLETTDLAAKNRKLFNELNAALRKHIQRAGSVPWQASKETRREKLWAEYRSLAPGEHPKTDVEKWDQWMTRYSKQVRRNLGPFFVKWKIPVTRPAREAIQNLPSWMHPDFAALGMQ